MFQQVKDRIWREALSQEKVCPECARDFWCDADYLNHMNEEHGHERLVRNIKGKYLGI